jgi:Bacterial Ig domain/Metallo-peptidase family M12B Reprolysin-like
VALPLVFLLLIVSSAQAAIARPAASRPIVAENLATGRSVTRYVREPRTTAASVSARAQAAIASGSHEVGVLLVTFSGTAGEPWSPAEARSEVFTGTSSANAFYEEESYAGISLTGKLRADGDVFGWFALNTPTAGCPYQEWVKKADQAAAAVLIYMFPHQGSCFWSGLTGVAAGGMSDGGATGVLINGHNGTQVVAHELGHAFGLLHAGSWTCTSGGVRVQVSENCTVTEYGDPFDVMGNIAPRHSSGWNLAKLGILSSGNIETVEASGTYSLRSALHPTAEPTVLRIPRARDVDGDVTSWYYLEVREKGGVFENVADATTSGVSVRVAPSPPGISPQTLLLDANPGTITFQDAPLAVGETFDGGPVKVKTVSAGAGSATVSVTLDEEPPTAPANLVATGGVEQAQLQWTASSDNFAVERYVVFRDGSEVGSTAGTGFHDASAPAGNHEYVVYAEDATGNRSAASNPASAIVTPDEEPPTAPTNLTASAGVEGVQLEWEASTDDVGVERYVVFRDGSKVENAAGTSFLDALAPVGDREYVVYAEDAVGNRSGASTPASVTVPGISGPACLAGSCRVTFRFTGAATTWSVPPGVGAAVFTVEGARGGSDSPQVIAGRGGRVVSALEPLTTGEEATVSVGGAGERAAEGGEGGFNGGGDGGRGAGGGGFSSVALDSTLMLLAAGGGGDGGKGANATTEEEPAGGKGGQGGKAGNGGTFGATTEALGAMLSRGSGGTAGGNGAAGGAGGSVTGSSTCPDGVTAGAAGAAGSSFAGGGGEPGAGGGGGGGYVGGGQGGGGAADACGDGAGSGGGGGGSSFAAPGLSAEFLGGARRGDGQVSIVYTNPIAAAEHDYLTLPGEELAVSASSGLLSDALGPAGDPLTASLVDPPAHGSLTVNDDGSFAYGPAPGYAGSDSFTYRIADPAGDYATAEVSLTIAAPPSAAIAAPAAGDSYAAGQFVSTAFSCGEGVGGPGMSSCTDSNGVKTGSGGLGHLDTATVGSHTYTVTALSKDGLTASTSIDYTVTQAAELPRPPAEPARDPPAPLFGVELSLSAQKESLRELLSTGKLVVTAKVDKAAQVMLTGSARLAVGGKRAVWTRSVEVFKSKRIGFSGPGEREESLTLSKRGREALRDLSRAKLTIIGRATDASAEVARRKVVLTLPR